MPVDFKNLKEMMAKFSDEDVCREYFEDIIWQGTPTCPHCGRCNPYKLKGGKKYRCSSRSCRKDFTVLTGTVFHGTKIPLSKWFMAIYITTNHKKGISSCQLARDISVTQPTAWFMLQRIFEMGKPKEKHIFKEEVMVDETYCGGKNKNKSLAIRKEIREGRRPSDQKTPVFGLVERNGKTTLKVVPDTQSSTLYPIIKEHVDVDTIIVSDGSYIYRGLSDTDFKNHIIINHSIKEYARDGFTTNHIESVFAILKRTIIGIHHQVSPKHLQNYCNIVGHRYNTRKMKDPERFEVTLKNAGWRLKYSDLIGKN